MVTLDQATKYWAVATLTAGGPSIRILADFFMLTLVYNDGGALGTDLGSSTYYLVITLLVLPGLLYYAYRHRGTPSLVLPLAFVISGAAGNLADRVRLGRVVDFLDVDFFDVLGITRWWTFNVADACLSVAILYLLMRFLFFSRHEPIEGTTAASDHPKPADSTGL